MIEPVYQSSAGIIYHGNVVDVLAELPEQSVDCCITSPPYWGLRDYGLPAMVWGGDPDCEHCFYFPSEKGNVIALNQPAKGFCVKCGAWLGCHGLEPTVALWVKHEVEIFRQVRRVLKDDGTVWLNLGDAYASRGGAGWQGKHGARSNRTHTQRNLLGNTTSENIKQKDLIGLPWRVAFALQADGWYLRSDIVWEKPNCMPESVKDRPTKSHEYIFLLSKSDRYYYDYKSIMEPASPDTHARYARGRSDHHKNTDGGPGNQTIAKTFKHMLDKVPSGWDTSNGDHRNLTGRYRHGVNPKAAQSTPGSRQNASFSTAVKDIVKYRNKRTVWKVPTRGFKGAHFATFPPALIEPCVLAGCPIGGTVLDPFFGAGTTGIVSHENGRRFIGIELGKHYLDGITIPRIKAATVQMNIFAFSRPTRQEQERTLKRG